MTKHEWRKVEKSIYQPKKKPCLIDIPEYSYIVLNGEGNPNSAFFAECIGALYSVAYAIKMNLKKAPRPPKGYLDWTVYPLEGVWDISQKAKQNFDGKINKDDLVFNLMIRQPHFVDMAFFNEMIEFTRNKKPNNLLNNIQFLKNSDGKCIQMLHTGSFDSEPVSFKLMEEYATELNLKRKSKIHREIYLSDFRKVPEEKLKTILRFQVEVSKNESP